MHCYLEEAGYLLDRGWCLRVVSFGGEVIIYGRQSKENISISFPLVPLVVVV